MPPSRNEGWPALIGSLVLVKQTLAQVDGGLWPHHYPEVKAGEEIIAATERLLGLRLSPSYRGFLLHANGWKGFFQAVDLLQAEGLIAGSHRAMFDASYGALREDEWKAIGLTRSHTLPFGISLRDKDAFVFDLTQEREGEFRVVWLAGEMIDDWPSFIDFFKSMIEYNRQEVQQFSDA